MLRSLNVKNIALMDNINVEFGEGLNVITGETGARANPYWWIR